MSNIYGMSFFNKIFGAEKKPAGPPPAAKKAPVDDTESQKIKIEAACNKLDTKIAEFEDR